MGAPFLEIRQLLISVEQCKEQARGNEVGIFTHVGVHKASCLVLLRIDYTGSLVLHEPNSLLPYVSHCISCNLGLNLLQVPYREIGADNLKPRQLSRCLDWSHTHRV